MLLLFVAVAGQVSALQLTDAASGAAAGSWSAAPEETVHSGGSTQWRQWPGALRRAHCRRPARSSGAHPWLRFAFFVAAIRYIERHHCNTMAPSPSSPAAVVGDKIMVHGCCARIAETTPLIVAHPSQCDAQSHGQVGLLSNLRLLCGVLRASKFVHLNSERSSAAQAPPHQHTAYSVHFIARPRQCLSVRRPDGATEPPTASAATPTAKGLQDSNASPRIQPQC